MEPQPKGRVEFTAETRTTQRRAEKTLGHKKARKATKRIAQKIFAKMIDFRVLHYTPFPRLRSEKMAPQRQFCIGPCSHVEGQFNRRDANDAEKTASMLAKISSISGDCTAKTARPSRSRTREQKQKIRQKNFQTEKFFCLSIFLSKIFYPRRSTLRIFRCNQLVGLSLRIASRMGTDKRGNVRIPHHLVLVRGKPWTAPGRSSGPNWQAS